MHNNMGFLELIDTYTRTFNKKSNTRFNLYLGIFRHEPDETNETPRTHHTHTNISTLDCSINLLRYDRKPTKKTHTHTHEYCGHLMHILSFINRSNARIIGKCIICGSSILTESSNNNDYDIKIHTASHKNLMQPIIRIERHKYNTNKND